MAWYDWKKAVSISDENKIEAPVTVRLDSLDMQSRFRAKGIAGDPLNEGVPTLIPTLTERVIDGSNNASIVLGRDRPSTRLSGYGGAGYTQAGSIDIVAGRWGSEACSLIPDKNEDDTPVRAWVNPSFENDAARIYISQTTDVDVNFQLAGGTIGNAIAKSAIALKADGIRVISRDGIKLITRTDARNSQGGLIENIQGVDLIAGNDDSDMQPLLRGNLAVQAMRALADQVNALNGIVDSLLTAQMQMNMDVTHHYHFSPFWGVPTSPSPVVVSRGIKTAADHLQNAKRSLITQKQNLEKLKATYLCVCSPADIRSRYHYLN